MDFLSGIKETMEGFLPGGITKSELHFVKITPDALEREKGAKDEAREQSRGDCLSRMR